MTDNIEPAFSVTQESIIVLPSEAGERLDRFLAGKLKNSGISREKIKRAIIDGKVLVNEIVITSAKHQLCANDTILADLAPPPTSLEPEQGDLKILYQDEWLAVIDKPAGLAVHPAPGLETGTLAHRLVACFPSLQTQEGPRPGIVHRIDKDTSGLLLVALTEQSRLALSALFADRLIYKEYLALVSGVPAKAQGEIKEPIGRHPTFKTKMAVVKNGKSAHSEWHVLYADPEKRFSLLAVRIHTGRTHQIRVHMTHMGHPLLGDTVYGCKATSFSAPASRQMLHAWKMSFTHPFDDNRELDFSCPLPEDFMETARALGLRTLRGIITGSPGCGKSALLEAFKDAGFPVFSSDAEVKALYEPGGEGHRQLRSRYGDRFVPDEKDPVNKLALGAAMRESAAFRREIEQIIHPQVQGAMRNFYQAAEESGTFIAIAEVPLYFEAGFGLEHSPNPFGSEASLPLKEKDESIAALLNTEPSRFLSIGVHCPFDIRRQRMIEFRGWDDTTISTMESWQWPEKDKMAACDLVIDNSGSRDELVRSAKELIERLLRIRGLRASLLSELVKSAGESGVS